MEITSIVFIVGALYAGLWAHLSRLRLLRQEKLLAERVRRINKWKRR